MSQELWSVRNKDGEIAPVVAPSPTDALKAAAKIAYGRSSAGAVGKLVLLGSQPIQVKLVALDGK